MNLSIILVVLGVAFTVQATPAQPPLEASIDVKDLIVSVYGAALNVTSNVVEKVIDIVDYVESRKEEIETKLIAKLVELAISAGGLEWQLLEAYRNNSNAAGLVIINCMEAEQNKTDAVIGKIVNELGTCLVDDSVGVETVKEILEEVKGFIVEIQKEVEDLKKCTSLEAVCLALFGTKQAVTYGKIAAAVAADKIKLEAAIATVSAHVLGCTAKLPLQIVDGLQPPFNDIANCIFSNK